VSSRYRRADNPPRRPSLHGSRRFQVSLATTVSVFEVLTSGAPAADTGGFQTVNLTTWFNNDGISTGNHLGDGNFTEGILYPAEGLPKSGQIFHVQGIAFRFPPKEEGMLNNLHCRGQVIDRPAAALYFLGSSDARLFDRQAGQDSTATTVSVHYVDGEREDYSLHLTNWWSAQPSFGNRLAVRTEGFHVQNRISQRGGVSLFAAAVYPRRSVPIDSLRLGDDETVHIFALTLSQQRLDDASITVDRLDWGSRGRPGDAVATTRVRALSDMERTQFCPDGEALTSFGSFQRMAWPVVGPFLSPVTVTIISSSKTTEPG